MKYKLIALDLDGTLCNDQKEITPETIRILKLVQEMGIRLVLCSARPIPGLFRQMRLLDLEKHHGMLIGYNGGKTVDTQGMTLLHEKRIPHELALSLLEYLKEFPVTPMIDDGISSIYVEDRDAYKVQHECWNNQMECVEVDSLTAALDFDLMKVLMSVQPEILYDTLAVIGKPFKDSLDFVRTAPFYIEAMPKNVNKAAGLKVLCKKLGIDPSEVIAYGDAENDLEMVTFAGYGVAMENACDALKEVATEVTLSNNEDGIAHSLKGLLNLS